MAAKKTKQQTRFGEDELPAEGAVYAFKLKDGRFGACRVLRRLPIAKTELGEWTSNKDQGWCLRVAATPWVGKGLPKLQEPLLREILKLTHHSWTGNKEVGLIACPPDRQFVHVGNLPPTDQDRRQIERTLCMGEWPRDYWAQQVLMQWEWDHVDRQRLLADEQAKKRQADAKEDRAATRRNARFSKMSLADFRRTRFLPRWSNIAPKHAVAETRQTILELIDRLVVLGRQPPRKKMLAEIKKFIQQLNRLQKRHDGFMATTERDDLCVHLADLFVVLGLEDDPALVFEKWEDL